MTGLQAQQTAFSQLDRLIGRQQVSGTIPTLVILKVLCSEHHTNDILSLDILYEKIKDASYKAGV